MGHIGVDMSNIARHVDGPGRELTHIARVIGHGKLIVGKIDEGRLILRAGPAIWRARWMI